MNAFSVVVGDVFRKPSMQMPFVEHDHLVQEFASTSTDPSFGDPVLPGASISDPTALCQKSKGLPNRPREDRIAVVHEYAGADASGKAWRSCWTTHGAVGFAATLKCMSSLGRTDECALAVPPDDGVGLDDHQTSFQRGQSRRCAIRRSVETDSLREWKFSDFEQSQTDLVEVAQQSHGSSYTRYAPEHAKLILSVASREGSHPDRVRPASREEVPHAVPNDHCVRYVDAEPTRGPR